MKWLLILVGVFAALFIGAVFVTYPQPFLKARDAVGTRYVSEIYPAEGNPNARVEYYSLTVPASDRPMIIMFASAGREASDFNELAAALNAAGYPVTLIEAPHIGASIPSKDDASLFDLAKDVHGIYAHHGKVVFLGHAFGNRVARASGTLYPENTAGIVLIGAGGKRPIEDKAAAALRDCFDPSLTIATRKEAIRYGFFADENAIPDYWMRGWHRDTAQLQGATRRNSPPETWWSGGTAPMLVIAGLQDTIAPPQDTIDLLEQEFPDRVTGIRLDGAGHALLPEKPDEIASAVLTWLQQLPTEDLTP